MARKKSFFARLKRRFKEWRWKRNAVRYEAKRAGELVTVRKEMDAAERASIRGYAESGVVESVEFITARDEKVCDYCRTLEGKIVPLEDVLKSDPILNGKCTGRIPGYDKPWCRCCSAPKT